VSLTVELTPELEQHLVREAARHGLDVGVYARSLLEKQLTAEQQRGRSLWETGTPEEWINAFEGWLNSHSTITAAPIPTEALRREHLYEERDRLVVSQTRAMEERVPLGRMLARPQAPPQATLQKTSHGAGTGFLLCSAPRRVSPRRGAAQAYGWRMRKPPDGRRDSDNLPKD
jgi:hypothetical protein